MEVFAIDNVIWKHFYAQCLLPDESFESWETTWQSRWMLSFTTLILFEIVTLSSFSSVIVLAQIVYIQ